MRNLCATLSDDEVRAIENALHACEDTLRKSGHLIVAQAPRALRVRRGRVSITDGPFAETNEQIGGVKRRRGGRSRGGDDRS